MISRDDIEYRPKKKCFYKALYLDNEVHTLLVRMAGKEKCSLPNMINRALVDYILNKKKLS